MLGHFCLQPEGFRNGTGLRKGSRGHGMGGWGTTEQKRGGPQRARSPGGASPSQGAEWCVALFSGVFSRGQLCWRPVFVLTCCRRAEGACRGQGTTGLKQRDPGSRPSSAAASPCPAASPGPGPQRPHLQHGVLEVRGQAGSTAQMGAQLAQLT